MPSNNQSLLSKHTDKQSPSRLVLGGFVEVAIPKLGVTSVMAKVDTGAFSGALHCSRIYEEAGTLYFTPLANPSLRTSTTKYEERLVRSANGHETMRFVIPISIEINGNLYDTLIGLTNRAPMKRDMLLGRRFLLDHDVLVDVQLTKHLEGDVR